LSGVLSADCLGGDAAIFQRPSEIDVRRTKTRIELEASAQGINRSRHVAQLPQGNGIIEIDEMQVGMGFVECDPDLIGLYRLDLLFRTTSGFCELEQLVERKALSAR